MANEKVTDLPTVTAATLSDIIYAVQGAVLPGNLGTSVQETMQQVFNLMLANVILNNPGNPNGVLAGQTYQFCIDTTNSNLYICTTPGSASSAVWTRYAGNIISPSDGGTGVANPTAHTIPIAEGSANFNFLALNNGQLLIGSTGADPVPANLTAGPGIVIGNNSGQITVSAPGGSGFMWNDVSGTSASMASFNGYVADNSGLVTLTLPTTANFGDEIKVIGKGSGGWNIAQNASQLIHLGNTATTTGTGGSLASTNQFDSIYIVCTTTNTTWTVMGAPQGIITVV